MQVEILEVCNASLSEHILIVCKVCADINRVDGRLSHQHHSAADVVCRGGQLRYHVHGNRINRQKMKSTIYKHCKRTANT